MMSLYHMYMHIQTSVNASIEVRIILIDDNLKKLQEVHQKQTNPECSHFEF